MGSVYVLGSINDDIVVGAERHPRLGETVRGSTLRHFPGGKGANQAIAAARAGAPTIMIGCTGNDAAGAQLIAYLNDSGVDTGFVRKLHDSPTGTALITVAGGDNTIVVVPGANSGLSATAVAGVQFAADDVVVAQFETPTETTQLAFERAWSVGARTVLNPAPAAEVSRALLAVTSLLVVNEHEFEVVFGGKLDELLSETKVPRAVAQRFNGVTVVTLGADGVVVWAPGGRIRHSGVPVEAVDSTGAGDCFVGYLAAGIFGGGGLEEATSLANRAAALSVTRNGAASSIPARGELT